MSNKHEYVVSKISNNINNVLINYCLVRWVGREVYRRNMEVGTCKEGHGKRRWREGRREGVVCSP